MNRDQFEDEAADFLNDSLPANFSRALHYASSILVWYLSYLSRSAGEAIPGEDWKAQAEGPPVEIGALRALLMELEMMPMSFAKDADKAKFDLAEICQVLLKIVDERMLNAEDPVAKLSLRKAKRALGNFVREASPVENKRPIQIQTPRWNRGDGIPDSTLAT